MNTASVVKPHLAILIVLSAIGPVALNIFLPSMPNLTESLNTSHDISQLTLTLYLVATACAQLILGPLSDKYGRRPVLLTGVGVYVVASLGCALAFNIEQLIFGRILQAAGGCAGIIITRAIVRDLYDQRKSTSILGYMTMIMAVAPMLSPIIGGYLDQWSSWRASFYLVTILGFVVFILSYSKLYETNHQLTNDMNLGNIFSKYKQLLVQRQYLGYVLGTSFGSAVFFAFIAGAPFYATKVLGLQPSEYGFYFIMVSLGYMSGNFISGRYASRLSERQMLDMSSIILALAISVLIYFSFTSLDHPAYLFMPMALVACSNGIAIPNGMSGALSVNPKLAGTASGLAGFIQISLGAAATFVVGYFHDGSALPMVICMVVAAVLSILGFKLIVQHERDSAIEVMDNKL
ncbi:MAG: multidrug effflux MFS transporter [Pseudomonadales bacterium]|nr:multidrug effflux MFS transporter [Pseudomonadales bacterium]